MFFIIQEKCVNENNRNIQSNYCVFFSDQSFSGDSVYLIQVYASDQLKKVSHILYIFWDDIRVNKLGECNFCLNNLIWQRTISCFNYLYFNNFIIVH